MKLMDNQRLQDGISELKALIAKDEADIGKWSLNYFNNHQKRYLFDLKLIEKTYSQGKILEIGSAPYHLTFLLKKAGYDVVGVDIDPERQKNFLANAGLDIFKNNIETEALPFPDNSVELIIFNEVFEHLRINPIKTLKEINRVLSPSGKLILSTPNLYSLQNIVNLILGKGFDDPYDQFDRLEKIGHMGHVREYTIKQVRKFLKNTGFIPKQVLLVSHTPLKGMWKLISWKRKVIKGLNTFQVHVAGKAQNQSA